jgi:hypothetical protein
VALFPGPAFPCKQPVAGGITELASQAAVGRRSASYSAVRNNSFNEVFERVFSSTFLTMTAQ